MGAQPSPALHYLWVGESYATVSPACPILRDQGTRRIGQAASKSPLRTRTVNASHAAGVKTSLGPFGSFESRTATIPGRLLATSTQFPPDPLLRLLLRQTARESSCSGIPRPPLLR